MWTLLQVIEALVEIQLQDYGKKIVQQLDKKKRGGNGSCATNSSGCSVKWKRIKVQQVLLAVIRDGSQVVPKESFRLQNQEYKQVCQAQFCWLRTVPLWAIRGQNLGQNHVSHVYLKWEKLPRVYTEAFYREDVNPSAWYISQTSVERWWKLDFCSSATSAQQLLSNWS